MHIAQELVTCFEQRIQPRLLEVQKPASYIAGERGAISKDWQRVDCRFALAFPDVYEIGMSYHGRELLYQRLNSRNDTLCERAFLPARDMQILMAETATPLWALESKQSLTAFDALGISLTHELAFPSALKLIELAGIPLHSADRTSAHPMVIAGGQSMCNPEPVTPFFDVIVNGEGEEVLDDIIDALIMHHGLPREELLLLLARIPGCYVPRFYELRDGAVQPLCDDVPARIERRWVQGFASTLPPVQPVQPYIQVPSDKAYIEVMRGCPRGCRFCQAGFITRPARVRSVEQVVETACALAKNTGLNEVGLMSLSTLDHPQIAEMVKQVKAALPDNVGVALPSLRADSMCAELAELIRRPRETSLTIAIEAGSESLRCAINKQVSDADITNTFRHLLSAGWHKFKLYFMCGFANEPLSAMDDIAATINGIFALAKELQLRKPKLRVSMSVLVPKAHTPFQWQAMERPDVTREKQQRLRQLVAKHKRAVDLHWHDAEQAVVEALISRGGRELAPVIESVMHAGQSLLSDNFDIAVWYEQLDRHNINLDDYVYKTRDPDEPLPYQHIDRGVKLAFLQRERQAYLDEQETPPCHESCTFCGLGCGKPLFTDVREL